MKIVEVSSVVLLVLHRVPLERLGDLVSLSYQRAVKVDGLGHEVARHVQICHRFAKVYVEVGAGSESAEVLGIKAMKIGICRESGRGRRRRTSQETPLIKPTSNKTKFDECSTSTKLVITREKCYQRRISGRN